MNKFLELWPRKPPKIDSTLSTLKLLKEDDGVKMLRQQALLLTADKSSHNKVFSKEWNSGRSQQRNSMWKLDVIRVSIRKLIVYTFNRRWISNCITRLIGYIRNSVWNWCSDIVIGWYHTKAVTSNSILPKHWLKVTESGFLFSGTELAHHRHHHAKEIFWGR